MHRVQEKCVWYLFFFFSFDSVLENWEKKSIHNALNECTTIWISLEWGIFFFCLEFTYTFMITSITSPREVNDFFFKLIELPGLLPVYIISMPLCLMIEHIAHTYCYYQTKVTCTRCNTNRILSGIIGFDLAYINTTFILCHEKFQKCTRLVSQFLQEKKNEVGYVLCAKCMHSINWSHNDGNDMHLIRINNITVVNACEEKKPNHTKYLCWIVWHIIM